MPPPSADPEQPDAVAAPPAVRRARNGVATVLLLLALLCLAWELWLAPTGSRFLAFKVLPLVLPLPGLLKLRLYTYRWVSLVVWLYFIEGVVRSVGDRGLSAQLAMAEVLLCLILFAACAAHVHLRLRRSPEGAA